MDGSITFGTLMRQPTAYLPVAMSLGALAMIVWFVAVHGVVHQPDEGAQAHLWQLLVAGQLPLMAYFAFRWLSNSEAPSARGARPAGRRRHPAGGRSSVDARRPVAARLTQEPRLNRHWPCTDRTQRTDPGPRRGRGLHPQQPTPGSAALRTTPAPIPVMSRRSHGPESRRTPSNGPRALALQREQRHWRTAIVAYHVEWILAGAGQRSRPPEPAITPRAASPAGPTGSFRDRRLLHRG